MISKKGDFHGLKMFCIVLLPETEMVRFELTRRFLDLTVFKTALLNLLSTSPNVYTMRHSRSRVRRTFRLLASSPLYRLYLFWLVYDISASIIIHPRYKRERPTEGIEPLSLIAVHTIDRVTYY